MPRTSHVPPGRRLLAALVLSAMPVATTAQYPQLLPVDEAPRDAGFLAFRTELLGTIARRDGPRLLKSIHPDIKNGFGGDDGLDAFVRIWRPEESDSPLWRELGSTLALGGTFVAPDQFVTPYVHSRWPGDVDGFEHVALIGSNVRVRAAPGPTAVPIVTLSFAILRRGDSGAGREEPWTSVRLAGGRRGYVATRLVRSPIDYRAFFARVGGRWVMSIFVAGD